MRWDDDIDSFAGKRLLDLGGNIAGITTLSLSVFCLAFYITQGADFGFVSPTGLAILGRRAGARGNASRRARP